MPGQRQDALHRERAVEVGGERALHGEDADVEHVVFVRLEGTGNALCVVRVVRPAETIELSGLRFFPTLFPTVGKL